MKMFHGIRFYAVNSRDAGTFGRAKQETIKIYRSSNSSSPACILDQYAQMTEFIGLIEDCGNDRIKRDAVMAEFVKFGG